MAFFEVYPSSFFFNLMTFICLVTLCVLEEFQVFAFYCMWHLFNGHAKQNPHKMAAYKTHYFCGNFFSCLRVSYRGDGSF